MALTPLPSLDPNDVSLPAQLNLQPGKIAGMTPLPPVPAPNVASMAASAPATPAVPPVLRPLVQNGSSRAQQEQGLQGDIQRLMPHPSEPGFWHKLGHVAAKIGNIAGDVIAPDTMALIPGTELNNRFRSANDQRQLAGLQAQDQAEQQQAEQNAQRNRQLDIDQQRADQEAQPKGSPWAVTNDYVGPNGEPVEMNKETGEVRLAQALPQGIRRYTAPVKPTAEKPESVMVNGQHGFAIWDNDKGWLDPSTRQPVQGRVTPIPQQPNFAAIYPQITGGRATDEATSKWQQAAGQYAGALGNLENAKNGSEVAAAIAPVAAALIEPTAAGTHRVNMPEINRVGGGLGSLARRVDAALAKAGNGALPPETIAEMRQLVTMYQGLKYRQYLAEVKRADDTFGVPQNQRFVTSMDGQTEMTLDDAMKQAGTGGGEGGQGSQQWDATATGKDGHQIGYRGGKWYDTQTGKAIQ